MRILEIIPSLGPGGAQSLVVDLCNEMAKTEDVILFSFRDNKKSYYGFMTKDISEKVQYINEKVDEKDNLRTLWTIYKIIKKVKPNIVHFHMCLTFGLLAFFLLGRKYPMYLTIHNDVKTSYSSIKIKVIINLLGKLNLVKFITISDTNYVDFKSIYHNISNSMIYNGRKELVKTKNYDFVYKEMKAYRITDSTKIYLHVARYNKQKNQELLVDAFNEFVKNGYDASLVIIGFREDTQPVIEIKKRACSRIFFLGTKDNIADYFYCSDFFCLSSRHEGMPITVIEAINCGVPVVSTPVCGVVDVIKDGENGIISSDHTLLSYIYALQRSYVSYLELKSKAEKFSKYSPYTMNVCAKEYLNIFKQNNFV